MTPLPGYSTPPQIPNITTSERPLVTTTVFAATTPENTPFSYHASTLINPNPMISPVFVEANYEILESLLRERRRQIRNEYLRTKLEYFSEDYDEEREMEPRPEPHREATPTLWLRFCSRLENKKFGRASLHGPPIHLQRSNGKYYWLLDKFHVLMISRKNHNVKKRPANHGEIGEITFLPLPNVGSVDPVIIKVYISGRQVNRVYLDGGSSCEVIYEHCFLKLKPSIRSLRVDSNTPLVSFSGEQSWPLGEIPLEITIGEGPIAVKKTLTFIIVKLDSPHNLLLGRTAMQQMGMVVSTVHGAIKFHTSRGIGTVFSEYNSQKTKKEEGDSTNKYQGNEEIILSCIDT
ncbi:reverse transcriptase domain-containing protein [Tanacetum coccineum]